MDIYSQIYILIFLVVCFGIYKLLRQMSNKRNSQPLRNPEDEEYLKGILSRMYSSNTLENLKSVLAQGVKCYPRYHDLFNVAMEEKRQEITQNTFVSTFEVKESKTRKTWALSFFTNYFIYWLSFIISIFLIDSPNEGLGMRLVTIIVCTVLIGFTMWIVYHCAFKKKGTGLLTCIVIGSPFQLLSSFAKEGGDLSLWYFTAFDIALFGFYWFSSLRLRKINYEVKARQQLAGLRFMTRETT